VLSMLEQLVILGLALNIVLTLWSMRILALEIKNSAQIIDHTVAAAIQKLIEGGLGDIEPINPIQQALASMITNRMQNESSFIDVTRSPEGTFAKKE